jgi:hypothetical protein
MSLLDDQVDQLRSRLGACVEKAEHITNLSHARGRYGLRDVLAPVGWRRAFHRSGTSSFGEYGWS